MIELSYAGDTFSAYVAEPVGEVRGGIVVIHEIWGLVEHIRGIADRYAAQGYLAIAPDILSWAGVDPDVGLELNHLMFSASEEDRALAQPRLRAALAPTASPDYAAWAIGALRAAVDVLAVAPGVDGRIGVLGYCFGGSYSFALAAADARVKVAVPYYGSPPEGAAVESIRVPVLAFYGEEDERLMQSLPEVTKRLHDAGVRFTAQVYPDAGHAFFNDTNRVMYRPAVAADAWTRTLSFLEESLREV
ncbi:carboxymethylenebutenolidase [Galbitalea soli]|nr:carboxymethylenebutenolidase [Galbitalea soli]